MLLFRHGLKKKKKKKKKEKKRKKRKKLPDKDVLEFGVVFKEKQ